jgi:hypothetical protein
MLGMMGFDGCSSVALTLVVAFFFFFLFLFPFFFLSFFLFFFIRALDEIQEVDGELDPDICTTITSFIPAGVHPGLGEGRFRLAAPSSLGGHQCLWPSSSLGEASMSGLYVNPKYPSD